MDHCFHFLSVLSVLEIFLVNFLVNFVVSYIRMYPEITQKAAKHSVDGPAWGGRAPVRSGR